MPAKLKYLSKKKIRAEGFTRKKNPAQAMGKKRFMQAENFLPPLHFLMVCP